MSKKEATIQRTAIKYYVGLEESGVIEALLIGPALLFRVELSRFKKENTWI